MMQRLDGRKAEHVVIAIRNFLRVAGFTFQSGPLEYFGQSRADSHTQTHNTACVLFDSYSSHFKGFFVCPGLG